jgi:hypothetical protein
MRPVETHRRTIQFSYGGRRMNDKPDIREGICPQCGHDEVIEAEQAEFTGEGPSVTYPMCVTYEERRGFPGQNPRHGHGPLYLYVCRGCGFCQWYVQNPGSIPVPDGHRTRLIKGGEAGATAGPARGR